MHTSSNFNLNDFKFLFHKKTPKTKDLNITSNIQTKQNNLMLFVCLVLSKKPNKQVTYSTSQATYTDPHFDFLYRMAPNIRS